MTKDLVMLYANNVSSFSLVLACWWLTHTYAAAGFPYGRPIAILWGSIGLSVMITAFARNLYIDPDPFIISTKCLMVLLCILISKRVSTNRRLQSELDQFERQTRVLHGLPPRPAKGRHA